MYADYTDDASPAVMTLDEMKRFAREYADYARFDHTHDAACVCEPTAELVHG